MARTVGVEIVIKAATSAAQSAVGALSAGFARFGALADRVKAGIGGFGKAAFNALAPINQGLEIAKKGMELYQQTIGASVAKSLELRAENDKLRKEYEAGTKAVNDFIGSVGDILLPIMLAVKDAFGDAGDNVAKYTEKNRELIGSRIVDVLAEVARITTSGVTVGFVLASRAVTGLQQVLAVLEGIGREALGGLASGAATLAELAARAARAAGKDGLAASISEAATAARDFAAAQTGAWDRASASVLRLAREQDTLESATDSVVDSINAGIGRFAVGAYQRLGEELRKTKQLTDGQSKAAAEVAKREAEWQQRRASLVAEHARDELAANERIMARTRANIAAQEAMRLESIERQREAFIAAQEAETQAATDFGVHAQSAFQGFADALASGIARGEKFGSVLKNALVTTITLAARAALIEISIEQIKAAAKAFSAHAGIPFVGPLLGAAAASAAAAAVGAIGAKLSGVGGMRTGGIVPGSGTGDRVPMMLEPGEAVIPRAQAAPYLDQVAQRTAQYLEPRGSARPVVLQMQSVVPATRAQMRAAVQEVMGAGVRRTHRLTGY